MTQAVPGSSHTLALGLADAERPRDWPPITGAEARRVLAGFGLVPRSPPLWQSARPFSAGALFEVAPLPGFRPPGSLPERVFLKRHDHRLRSASRLETEHAFMAHLMASARQNLHIPLPLQRITTPADSAQASNRFSGTTEQEGGNLYEVFPAFRGEDLYRHTLSWEPYRSPIHAASAGRMLARLHLASTGFNASDGDVLLMSGARAVQMPDLEAGLTDWLPTQPGMLKSLAQLGMGAGMKDDWRRSLLPALAPAHQALRPYLGDVQPLWGHGDWHGSNLSWKPGIVPGKEEVCEVFDFGLSGYTSAPFDLAVAVERSFIRWMNMGRDPVAWDQLHAFLAGYDAIRPRTLAERQLTGRFLPLVHVQFALTELAYYAALLHDLPTARRDVWSGYLLGHARWFESPVGQKLIEAVAVSAHPSGGAG
ncbi:phosphotransferase enzyme family protein [Oecophyllibacter saccharovorans]|uniref:phosphotransferase enzyme family protein n=1 Tax=Oecophyllibacter saccharovorans TaxID=2558360 RepID=UPI001167AAAD|nr:phosphotransferase [Oecophyllibacter saccharovorans]TPW36253.1 hypothetical protein E3203_00110 [Oecophyllibacter saccharovorans]